MLLDSTHPNTGRYKDAMEVQMVLNFVNHPRKIASNLQPFHYVQNFNLLNPETDGRNLPMVAKPVG